MSAAELRSVADGRLSLVGALTFASVPALRAQAGPVLGAGEGKLEIDLSGVEHADSAGVALLVDWMRLARRSGRSLQYLNMPAQMLAIARVSSLDQILPLARR